MPTPRQQDAHRKWLVELTAIPTAAGHEDRVIKWVERWARRRTDLRLRRDAAGNVIITTGGPRANRPIFLTAHLDHPAFVVRRTVEPRTVELEFRGGVREPYFDNAELEIFDGDDAPHRARIVDLTTPAGAFKRVTATLRRATPTIKRGDVGRWAFNGRGPRTGVSDGILRAHACDDLAAVAAALSALDILRRRRRAGRMGVLLTRGEEVGFLGATAACKHRSVPRTARLICLENSRSFAESPIGAGPIVRVGDRLSVFCPALTNRLSAVLTAYHAKHPDFRWQRKLMPGGACEATTFSSYGYESTCVCLPLGNYHNMADIDAVAAGKRPARVAPEYISVDDYHGMIDLLIVGVTQLDSAKVTPLAATMDDLYERWGYVLEKRRSDEGGRRPLR